MVGLQYRVLQEISLANHLSTFRLGLRKWSGKYLDPAFAWNHSVTPTAIKFLNSDKLGNTYENDLFVARHNGGVVNQSNRYHFDLNSNRSALLFNDSSLQDKEADNIDED